MLHFIYLMKTPGKSYNQFKGKDNKDNYIWSKGVELVNAYKTGFSTRDRAIK